jgi:GxxExxY protein
VGVCMEIHRELGNGHDEIIYKDAFVVELSRAGIPFLREQITKSPIRESSCRTIIMRTLWSGIKFSLKPKRSKN